MLSTTIMVPKQLVPSYMTVLELRANFMLKQPGCIKMEYYKRTYDQDVVEMLFIGKWTSLQQYQSAHDKLINNIKLFQVVVSKFGERAAHAMRVLGMNKSQAPCYKLFAESQDDHKLIFTN